MTDPQPRFADRLLAADPPSAAPRDRYQKEVRAMFDKSLTPRERGGYLLGSVFVLLMAAFLGANAVAPPPTPDFLKYILVYLVLTSAAFFLLAGVLFWAFWRGVINERATRRWAAGVGVVYIGLVGWTMMNFARHLPEMFRDEVKVFGLVILIYAAVAWVRHRIAQAEMNTAEKLLELELRLAEMANVRASAPATVPPNPAGPTA